MQAPSMRIDEHIRVRISPQSFTTSLSFLPILETSFKVYLIPPDSSTNHPRCQMDSTSTPGSDPKSAEGQIPQPSAPLTVEKASEDAKPTNPQSESVQASESKLKEGYVSQLSANNTANDSLSDSEVFMTKNFVAQQEGSSKKGGN